ncbi:ANM_collapsed_G0015280.mRNA.1.CDS.1 [Saccharomyces cerevisiae]|nr:ANM_collapsed_G0015280.mRNA.1.CDS.1 [Saccharomyces cerevisiae]
MVTTLTPVICESAPAAAASYSHAMKVNNLIFLSGQIPVTPDNKLVEGSIADKAEQVIQNIKNVLEASNSSLDRVVKLTFSWQISITLLSLTPFTPSTSILTNLPDHALLLQHCH